MTAAEIKEIFENMEEDEQSVVYALAASMSVAQEEENTYNIDLVAAVQAYLTAITDAKYGEEVRNAIYNSIYTIADTTGTELTSKLSGITALLAASRADSAQISDLVSKAGTILREMQLASQSYGDLQAAIENFTNIEMVSRPYEKVTGSDSYRLPANTPGYVWDSGQGRWKFYYPVLPQFNDISINWVKYSESSPENFRNSGVYNPNEGKLDLRLQNFFSNIEATAVTSDPGTNAGVSVQWVETANSIIPKLALTFSIPRGSPGTGAEGLDHRPYFYDFPSLDPSNYIRDRNNLNAPPPTFQNESKVGRYSQFMGGSNTIQCLGDITILPGQQEPIQSNIFQGAFIVFRKSVDNNDEEKNILKMNFGSNQKNRDKVLFKDNTDYDTTFTVYVPKGQSVTATYTDAAKRTFKRTVHFTAEPWVEVADGGSGLAKTVKYMPLSKALGQEEPIAADADLTAYNTGSYSVDAGTIVAVYQQMFVFEHAVYVDKKKGNKVEWSKVKTGTGYTNQPANAKEDMSDNRYENQTYDQFLIPIRIIGVSYGVNEQYVASNIQNNIVG